MLANIDSIKMVKRLSTLAQISLRCLVFKCNPIAHLKQLGDAFTGEVSELDTKSW